MNDQEVRNRIVEKLLRNRVVGGHETQVTTAVSRYLPSHAEGRGKQLVDEMVADTDAPIEAYGGGHRENIRLTSVDAAVEYLEANGGNVPFGFD